jgi:hypothetical protein
VEPPEGLLPTHHTICIDHIADRFLRRLAGSATDTECSFCDRRDEAPFAVSMGLVAGPVYDVALWWFRDLDGDPYAIDYETSEVVAECAEEVFTDDVAEQVIAAITEAVATPTAWSSNNIQDEFTFNWDGFVQTVKHESRFVYLAARDRDGDHDPPGRVARFLEGLLAYADK